MALNKPRTKFFQTCLGVFQGGGCRGAAFVGALMEAAERGVDFAGVAGASAGSVVAALVGAGASAEFLHQALGSLDFRNLLTPPEAIQTTKSSLRMRLGLGLASLFVPEAPKLWKYNGLYSSRGIENWMNKKLRELMPKLQRIRFRDLRLPTYIVAADVITNDVKIWSSATTPDDEVAVAVRCSCSIPGFFQPVGRRFIDGGVLSNLPSFVFSGSGFEQNRPFANRILAFTLVAAHSVDEPTTALGLLGAVASTVVDGSSMLQGRLVGPIHEIAIDTGDIRATDFDKMDSQRIAWLVGQGRTAAAEFFDDELGRVRQIRQRSNLLSGDDELYSAVAETLDEQVNDIVISDVNARWVYALYPTLLGWRCRGSRIRVILPPPEGASAVDLYQRRVLRALGAELFVATPIPFRGFLFNPSDEALARAVIIAEAPGLTNMAVRYYSPLDFAVIVGLWKSVSSVAQSDPGYFKADPKVVRVADQAVLDKLTRYIPAYSSASARLSMETIPLKSLVSMTRMVRGFKFKQIQQLFQLFTASGLRFFEAAVVQYAQGLSTIITPPVVEYSGGRYIVIQGNTRAVYSYRNGIDELRCVVVRDPSAPLPSDQRVELRDVLIGDRTVSTSERYGAEIDKDYRNIEFATHRPDETLTNVEI